MSSVDDWNAELHRICMVNHAVAYARKGWPVMPIWWPSFAGICACPEGPDCSAAAKHPLIRDGLKEATTDTKQVMAWWSRWPLANIAIVTGERSGVTVLDLDGQEGNDSFQVLMKRYGRPDATPVALTGGGGRHIFWKYYPGHRCRQAVKPGIDVRSTGGYVLAAPSLHSSGLRYEWHEKGHPGRVAVGDAPGWALPLLTNGRVSSGPVGETLKEGPIGEGTRNRTLFRWACRFQRQQVSDEELSNRLHDMNERLCKPPLPPREVETIVSSALRYPKGVPA